MSRPSLDFIALKKPLIRMCHAYLGPTGLSNTSAAQSTDAVNSPATDETVPSSVAEHRRVFNYSARGGRSFQPKAQLSRNKNNQKGKKKVQTCTLKCFCLGNVDDEKPPLTISAKAALSNCGLGPGSVTCDVHALSIHDYLLERFPPLALAGGYELCLFQRGGEDQGFYKLPMPYSPARLKDVAGQAIIYIRPLQRNILSGIQNQEQDVQSEVSGEMSYPICLTTMHII